LAQKVKVTSHKNTANMGRCTLVSAGCWWLFRAFETIFVFKEKIAIYNDFFRFEHTEEQYYAYGRPFYML